jgi:hypothetical protein
MDCFASLAMTTQNDDPEAAVMPGLLVPAMTADAMAAMKTTE